MNIYVEMTDSQEIDRFSFRCLLIKFLCFPYSQWSLWCLYWQTGHKRRKAGLYKNLQVRKSPGFFLQKFPKQQNSSFVVFLRLPRILGFFFSFRTRSQVSSALSLFCSIWTKLYDSDEWLLAIRGCEANGK